MKTSILATLTVSLVSLAGADDRPQTPASAQTLPLDVTTPITIKDQGGALAILCGDKPVATYVYRHDKVLRPFFAHVKSPSGTQVTRNFPPGPGDRPDHADMHPGIWLAFGDLSGEDFWRNKGRVVHDGFSEKPTGGPGRGHFTQQKLYRGAGGQLICHETFRCTIRVLPTGYLIEFDVRFRPPADGECYFGDQEEMGLGVRVATPLTELNGGAITDSTGRRGAAQIWSQAAAWCDYSGHVEDEAIGITILCHPDNFRGSWMHARNYGLVAANPFGRSAMQKGASSKIVVTPEKPLRLRYGVFLHGAAPDLPAIYRRYVQ